MNVNTRRAARKAPQSRAMSASLRRLAARRFASVARSLFGTIAAGAALVLGGSSASAQTFTYSGQAPGSTTTPTTGVFTNGFNGDGAAGYTTPTSSTTTGLVFAGTTYTATDDLTTSLTVNALTFSNTGAVTLARGGAGTNNSLTLGGTTPTITLSNSGNVVEALDLILGVNTTFTGAGAGGANVSGAISGGFSLTKSGTSTLVLSSNNTYTGGTLLNSSAGFGIGSDTAVGTGTLTLGTASAGQNIFISALNGDRTIANNVVFNGNRLVIDSSAYGSGLTVGNLIINGTFAFNGTSPSDIFLRRNLTLNGVVSGSNSNLGITLNGDVGVLALTNAGNTFSGGIKFTNASVVLANSDGALGAAANTLAFNAGGNGTLRAGASFNSARNASAVTTVAGTFDTNGFNLGLSGILSGAGGYKKAGTGTLTLSGANTYTGGTTVTAGTLVLGVAGAIDTGTSGALGAASSALTVNGGTLDLAGFSLASGALTGTGGTILNSSVGTTSTLTVGSGNGTGGTFAGNIVNNGGTGGTIALTKTGTGTVTLSGNNTYTGGTNINQGTLSISAASGATSSGAVPAGTMVNVANGAKLNIAFQGSDGATKALVFNNFTLNLNGGNSLAFGGPNLDYATLPGNVNLTGTNTITAPNIRDRLTLSGVVSGTGDLVFSGGGAQNSHFLVLSGANTYAGSTNVTSGTGGATIQLSGGADRLPTATTLTLNASSTNPAQLDLNGQNQTLAGLLSTGTAANDAVVNSSATASTLTINNSGADTYGGILGAPAQTLNSATVAGTNFGLTKAGAGTLTLGSANGYTGNTLISAGSINLLGTTASLGTGTVTINGTNLTLQNRVGATTNITNNLSLAGSQALNVFNSVGFSFTGAINLTGDTGIRTDPGQQAGNTTFSGPITGTANLIFYSENGNGTTASQRFVLSGANNYNGNTTITSGTGVTTGTPFAVQLTGGNDRLSTSGTLTFGGDPAGGTGSHNANANLELNGISQTVAGLQTAAGATGTYRIIGTSATASTLTVNNAASNLFTGILGGTGTNNNTLALTKTGAGTLTLNGASTYTGGTQITSGALAFNNGGALGTGGTTITNNAALTLQANSNPVTYAGPITIGAGGGMVSAGGGNNNLTLTGGIVKDGTTLTFLGGGTVNVSSAISGPSTNSDLVVDGTTVSLNAVNTYNGPTTVQNVGTMILNNAANSNSATGTGTLTVNGTGSAVQLAQNNQIADADSLTLGGGTFAVNGQSEGTATAAGLGTLALTSGTTSVFDFAAPGGLSGPTSVVSFTAYDFNQTGILNVANYTGNPFTGAGTGGGGTDQLYFGTTQTYTDAQIASIHFVSAGAPGGFYGATQLASGEIVANSIAPTPEPGGLIPLVIGVAGTGVLIARRRRKATTENCQNELAEAV